MLTPHDWKNGADYSDEAYKNFHRADDVYNAFGKFLKMIFIAVVCSLAVCLIIWQWKNITEICNSLYSKISILFVALYVPYLVYVHNRKKEK